MDKRPSYSLTCPHILWITQLKDNRRLSVGTFRYPWHTREAAEAARAPYVLVSGNSGSEPQSMCTRRGEPRCRTPTSRRPALCCGRLARETDKPSPGQRILPDKSDNAFRVHTPVRTIPIGGAAKAVLLVNAVQQFMPENNRQMCAPELFAEAHSA